ncbi:MAG: hypothetical protein E3J78_01805 [Candidatus Cloacimonadota bacterium]|nr:MAG: hypothetical protein E3J78_01805 [Candidatus Cloacimonadota bacterium]
MKNNKGGKKMVDVEEGEEIKIEAEEITRELCTVFETQLKNMIRTEDKLQEIVHDIVAKTLVCKANRDNPNYPNSKSDVTTTGAKQQ